MNLAINKVEVDNLHFISRGQVPPNPSELLMHANFRELLAELSERYDLIDDFGTSPLFRHFRARDVQENTLVSVKLLRSIMREYPDVFDAVKVSALTHLSLRSDHIAQLLDEEWIVRQLEALAAMRL